MSKVLNYCGYVLTFLVFVLYFYLRNIYGSGSSFNGIDMILFSLFISSYFLRNMYFNTKVKIDNIIYLLFYNSLMVYFVYIGINSIFLNFINGEGIYLLADRILIILGLVLFNFLISLLFKKEKILYNSDNSHYVMFFLLVLSFFRIIFGEIHLIVLIINIIGVFLLVRLIFKYNHLVLRKEFQNLYAIIFLIYFIDFNYIGMILLTSLYFKLDKEAVNL